MSSNLRVLVYTFRTFKELNKIENVFENVIVLSKLKQDLEVFKKRILTLKPEIILGIATSSNFNSYIEPTAINKFNTKSKVLKKSQIESLNLHVPSNIEPFIISKNPSTSFCNYSMFIIQNFLNEQDLE